MLKRGGRSYDVRGINGTMPGELAVVYPACPIPSINLPPNWKSVRRDSEYVGVVSTLNDSETIRPRYLYYQTFGVDACFCFKRRQISSYDKDPELGPGYAYLVGWNSYNEYLRCFTDQNEVRSICLQMTLTD